MSFLHFSTASSWLIVEDVLGLILFRRTCGITSVAVTPFPQVHPHTYERTRSTIFNVIAALFDFCTGSTTITKNMNQEFLLS